MIKVFLVEDEFIVREGIKKNIDWEKHGYEFVGEASDGELAFPLIQKLKPDIVITDIKMPFMDGISLSKLIKKDCPDVEIIILSGYEEFEYAKEAIKIGVSQYLSKPISADELIKEVDILSEKIKEKNKEKELKERYEKEMLENELKDRKDFFISLVSGNKSFSELLQLSESKGIDLTAIYYNIVLLKLQSINHTIEEYSNSIIEIEDKISNELARYKVLAFDRNLEGKALLFKADTIEELKENQDNFFNKLKEILSDYPSVKFNAGIGMIAGRLSDLKESFEKAAHAFAHRFFDPDVDIVDSENILSNTGTLVEEIEVSQIDTKLFDRKKIKDFLKIGESDEASYFVDEYFDSIGRNALNSTVFRQYIIMDVYFCVVEFLESISLSKEEIEPVDKNPETLINLDEAYKYCVSIIKKATELRVNSATNKYAEIVNEVKDYIELNYADEELSLNVIANHVQFSPNHLSSIFSQETGVTFIKYLTDYRLNKAKELLKCSSKRSSEIALEVGYKDPHYFSYLFKKSLGMTPTAYREGNKSESEEIDEI